MLIYSEDGTISTPKIYTYDGEDIISCSNNCKYSFNPDCDDDTTEEDYECDLPLSYMTLPELGGYLCSFDSCVDDDTSYDEEAFRAEKISICRKACNEIIRRVKYRYENTLNGKELNNSSKAPGLYISDFIDEAVDFLLRKGKMSRSEVDFALKSRKRELYEYIRDKIVCVD